MGYSEPVAQRRVLGIGKEAGYRCQRPRPDPGHRDGAVPGRYQEPLSDIKPAMEALHLSNYRSGSTRSGRSALTWSGYLLAFCNPESRARIEKAMLAEFSGKAGWLNGRSDD
jgi:hypothetical protein